MSKFERFLGWCDKHFIEDWRFKIKKLWTIRMALFWGAICGLYAAWPAFQDWIAAPYFAAASVVMSMAIVGARVTKQPGVDE